MADVTPILTIDGPVGSGKGTIAARVARRLGWHLLDSGALYRLVAIAALDQGISPGDEAALIRLARGLDIEFSQEGGEVIATLDGLDVRKRMRSPETSDMASQVATIPGVRAALKERQRAFAEPPGLVADGRDMGTVIFPDAETKIYLTASVEVRAQRRHKQLKEKGESVNLSRLSRDIEERDHRDMNRTVAPLRPARDAIVVDSTALSIDQVVEKIIALMKDRSITD